MKHTSLLLALLVFATACAKRTSGVCFDRYFEDSTLRIDISARGDSCDYFVQVDSVVATDGWWGRRVNLATLEYPDALTVALVDLASGDTIYVSSKYLGELGEPGQPAVVNSSLFVPRPKAGAEARITVWGYGTKGWEPSQSATCSLSESVLDNLKHSAETQAPYKTIREAADPKNAIYIAIVAEGYRADEMDKFLRQAERVDSALFSHKAFADFADRFNVVAVQLPSAESGISRPSKGETYATALGAHFDSYNLDRLITIPDSRRLFAALSGVPYAHVMILANTDNYGGSGSTNEYAIACAGHGWWAQIMVHEFGHAFANLADEYEAGFDTECPSHLEPDSPNITTLHDFRGKWQNLIDEGKAGLIEGAGYQSKGVWRGCDHCLMRDLQDLYFCPVCEQAIARTILYQLEPR